MKRAGTVRVNTYTQLFAAARILAMGRIPRGDRLAIVTNGRGPGTLAADSAMDRGVPLADARAPKPKSRYANPCRRTSRRPIRSNVRGDASPALLAAAVDAAVRDANVDAVLALHVDRPLIGATEAARAVATVALGAQKPVLGAWLGALDRPRPCAMRCAQEAFRISTRRKTPSRRFRSSRPIAAIRRWLLEVPPPQPEPQPPDTGARPSEFARKRRARIEALLTELQTEELLRVFGLPVTRGGPRRYAQGSTGSRRASSAIPSR